jgi:hypothetical protein
MPAPSYTFTSITEPGGNGTSVSAINDRGEVAGTYVDSSGTEHGFVATPHGGETAFATFDELLSAHARHGGVNDLPPRIPGIPGGSLHSANASRMMDQMAAAGPCCTPMVRRLGLARAREPMSR